MLRQNDQKISKAPSLRKAINQNCKNCIYDSAAAGTWRQQVSLCSVTACALHPVRPITKYPIPESVLDYYSITGLERDRYTLKNTREGYFSDQTGIEKTGVYDSTVAS